ncbi:MAG: sialate O-acetylesterase, partial [Lentisphaerota bacterium]
MPKMFKYKSRNIIPAVILALAGLCGVNTWADVSLPAIFSDHMVLQRDAKIPVWGWSLPQATITLKFAGKEYTTKVEKHTGRWRIDLEPLPAGGPYEMAIRDGTVNGVTLKNVMVGEVWLCSGQSNMEMQVRSSDSWGREDVRFQQPNIRVFKVQKATASAPQQDLHGTGWKPVNNSIYNPASDFSAVGWHFACDLQRELGVAVGVIESDWGATTAEAWMSRQALESDSELAERLTPFLKGLQENGPGWIPAGKRTPTALYNAMIAPLQPFAFRGVLWYQGESDENWAPLYGKLFSTLITSWRQSWGHGDFPFLFVQLAGFREPAEQPYQGAGGWPRLREEQAKALALPNTAMAIDIGNPKDVHPKNKQEVARRLFLAAMAKVYGKDVPYSGPTFESSTIEENRIRIKFKHAE